MRQKILALIDNVIISALMIVAVLTPVLFLNKTTEFYETPKLVFLIFSTVLLIGLWIISWIVRGKIAITRTPLDIPLIILGLVIIVSSLLSETRFISIFGNLPRIHGSATSWLTYIILYFVTVSNLKNVRQLKLFIYAILTGALIVSIISILSFFKIYLPFDFARAVNFTPTGSTFSTTALLLLLLPLPLFALINPNKTIPPYVAILLTILFGITIILISPLSGSILLFLETAACFFVSKPEQLKKTFLLYLAPVTLIGTLFIFAYLPFAGNPIHQMQKSFPQEVQLPLDIAWKISASALRDSPILGTGPSTFQFSFTNYRPAEFNLLRFWNFSFDTSNNEFLHVMTTLGFAGLIALIFLCIAILNSSRRNLSHSNGDENNNFLLHATAVSGVISIILLGLHATTLISLTGTIFILALLMASQKNIREHILEISFGGKSHSETISVGYLPLAVFLVYLVAAGYILLNTFNSVLADYYHRLALSQASKNGSLTYSFLQKAETLNPNVDLYRVDLAQTNFALANAIATQKGPSESNPQGTLTDQDKKTIQTLLSQAISEGKAAVALNPKSSRNWEVLGSIYRNISGVAENSLAFSLDAYGRAIQLDPLNPSLRLAVGGIYYSAKNYDLAIRFFSDSINLKNDYANAYYNLAITLRDKGDLQNAIVVAEKMMTLLTSESQDYKTGTVLVEDLNKRLSGETGSSQVPTGQAKSALENKNITDVEIDLNDPPKTSTPSAVRNSAATTPTPKP